MRVPDDFFYAATDYLTVRRHCVASRLCKSFLVRSQVRIGKLQRALARLRHRVDAIASDHVFRLVDRIMHDRTYEWLLEEIMNVLRVMYAVGRPCLVLIKCDTLQRAMSAVIQLAYSMGIEESLKVKQTITSIWWKVDADQTTNQAKRQRKCFMVETTPNLKTIKDTDAAADVIVFRLSNGLYKVSFVRDSVF